ncbi:MAG: zinc dependent phospholipase C family protein, partial [Bryobacteraceae bacterium]
MLSHEAIIDASWDVKLKPVLSIRYPKATPDELRTAHAFAYGGSIIQDLGYYPHGSKEFSNLTHYVRTGDFVLALLSESHNLNEFAFALGA